MLGVFSEICLNNIGLGRIFQSASYQKIQVVIIMDVFIHISSFPHDIIAEVIPILCPPWGRILHEICCPNLPLCDRYGKRKCIQMHFKCKM